MRLAQKLLPFFVVILVSATTASAGTITRSAGGYGDPTGGAGTGITVNLQTTPDSNGFQQIIVCGGGNTIPDPTSTCGLSSSDPSGAVGGVFDLLVNVPALSAGTVVDITLPFAPSSSDFGLLVDCPGQFNPSGDGALFGCVTPAGITSSSSCATDVSNGFSAPGSSMTWTDPSCAAGGVTLFFESDSPFDTFATIGFGGTVAAPESSTSSYLGLCLLLLPLMLFWRRRCSI